MNHRGEGEGERTEGGPGVAHKLLLPAGSPTPAAIDYAYGLTMTAAYVADSGAVTPLTATLVAPYVSPVLFPDDKPGPFRTDLSVRSLVECGMRPLDSLAGLFVAAGHPMLGWRVEIDDRGVMSITTSNGSVLIDAVPTLPEERDVIRRNGGWTGVLYSPDIAPQTLQALPPQRLAELLEQTLSSGGTLLGGLVCATWITTPA